MPCSEILSNLKKKKDFFWGGGFKKPVTNALLVNILHRLLKTKTECIAIQNIGNLTFVFWICGFSGFTVFMFWRKFQFQFDFVFVKRTLNI